MCVAIHVVLLLCILSFIIGSEFEFLNVWILSKRKSLKLIVISKDAISYCTWAYANFYNVSSIKNKLFNHLSCHNISCLCKQ